MAKSRSNKFIDTIDECLTNGVKNGIFQVSLEDNVLNGRLVTIDDHKVVNFGSCSYLGLEVDDRLKQGAIDATIRYGTQYSSSRLFSACNLNEELEDLFYKIFDNNPSILAATTTLTHVSAIPILVQDDDLIILDHQVHGSVQLAVQLVKARGTQVAMIKHNRMDMLEDLIKDNPNKYNKIWYMADGLYSMYGDYAPLKDIVSLLDKYGNFYFYVDDAHGMSWTGKHGNGYVLSQIPLHPKMALSTSLAKGFGTGGGVLVLKDPEMRRKIFTCGSSYTYSGPVQPPMLGASIASAKIHLTDEIYTLQDQLKAKLKLTQELLKQYNLPLVLPSDDHSPIFYLGLGLPRVGYNMVKRLLKEGFYTNIGIFPGVPVKCCGLRLAITNGQTKDDIKNVIEAFAYHFPKVLEEEEQTVENISANFDMSFEQTRKHYGTEDTSRKQEFVLSIEHETTIHKVDKNLWDDVLAERGVYDWEGCRFLEDTFNNNPEPENNWKFHYIIIKDNNKKTILATFFTEAIWKDDMVAPAIVSQQIEEIRKTDRYYLSSKVIMLGSLITIGDHLYIDKSSANWKDALLELIKIMNIEKEKSGATMLQLRDFDTADIEISNFLIKEGFIKVEMPDTHTVTNIKWQTETEYLSKFSSGSRWHFKKLIQEKKQFFNVDILEGQQKIEKGNIHTWYKLYENVKRKSFNINTYELPIKYFQNMQHHPCWEVIELRLKHEFDDREEKDQVVSVGFCYKSSKNTYSFMAVGIDYNYVYNFGCYRQVMYQCLLRANQLKSERLYLGMDAAIEKKRFGVEITLKSAYVQANDNFNMEFIGTVFNK